MTVMLAAAWDRWLGEPAARWHPVTLMGRYLTAMGRLARRSSRPTRQFAAGTAGWLAGAVATAAIAAAADRRLRARAPRLLRPLIGALLLKPLFAHRLLLDEVASVDRALDHSLEEGRRRVARIVGRDPAGLSASDVREAALESLAENFSDSVVAPLMWFSVAGIPGAALYRYLNTADAMWGHRGAWEWAGKTAAVADDIANFVPARVTAALIAGGAFPPTLAAEAGKTRSPNAGWPMAAMALRRGVRLGKPAAYELNAGGRQVTAADIAAGRADIERAAGIAFIAAAIASYVIRHD